MDDLHPIDKDAIEPVLAPAIGAVETIHRQRRRIFALGAIASMALAASSPLVLSNLASITAFQAALVAAAGLLVGLTVLRGLAAAQSKRLKARFETLCDQKGLDRAEIVRVARLGHGRWFFFTALWDGDPGDGSKEVSP